MRKKVKRIGNSIGIIFNKEEQEVHGIEVGNIVDLIITYVRDNKHSGFGSSYGYEIPKKKVRKGGKKK